MSNHGYQIHVAVQDNQNCKASSVLQSGESETAELDVPGREKLVLLDVSLNGLTVRECT